jgi:hypothetical protein
MNMQTPWGRADNRVAVGNGGIAFFSTPSHGGYYVPPELRETMPQPYRAHEPFCRQAGWYEEDCDWSAVALSFPHLFGAATLEQARATWAWLEQRKAAQSDSYSEHGGTGDGAALSGEEPEQER